MAYEKKRRDKPKDTILSRLEEYRVELIALLIGSFGIFLLIEPFQIRATVRLWLTRMADGVVTAIESLIAYLGSFTLSDLIGLIIVVITLIFLAWRGRYRFLHSNALVADQCPRCDGTIHRVHRTTLDRLIGFIFQLELRRFSCDNLNCSWSSLRRGDLYKERRNHEAEEHEHDPAKLSSEPNLERAID